ncbi:MAG: PHP domain-containing protein [Clostridiales bacterium]|nr:PHP domain-containing protein [Clostridiales bacterium]
MKRVDYHVHTNFSDGQASYAEVIDRAKEIGLYSIAITDHFDSFDKGKSFCLKTDDELMDHFDRIREYGSKIGQNVLCGIETCTDYEGNLRLSDIVIESCDIIITSPHYVEYDGPLIPGHYFNDCYWEAYKRKVLNMARGPGDILGHSEGYLPLGKLLVPGTTTYEERKKLCYKIACRYFDNEYIDELAKMLKISGKALELHCATHTPREAVIQKMIENKISISLGSDSHVLPSVGKVEWGLSVLEKYNGEKLQFIK